MSTQALILNCSNEFVSAFFVLIVAVFFPVLNRENAAVRISQKKFIIYQWVSKLLRVAWQLLVGARAHFTQEPS